jgi:protein disulfide-isomerase-like protein
MKTFFAFLGLVAASASAKELTKATWGDASAGKVVFTKFFAPWCGHCKKMKPAWDELMEAYADSQTHLIADVDCTAEDGGKELCADFGVKGFPTIKFGDPGDLETYKGGRDIDALKQFAEGLKPICSPLNMDACNDDQKVKITTFQEMGASALDAIIAEEVKVLQDTTKQYESEIERLNDEFNVFKKEKAGLISMMKASKLSAGGAKEEL